MLNSGRVNPELTGMSKNLWALLMYVAVFLFWNDYQDKENKFFTITGLKLFALLIFVFLIFKFRSGQSENNGSLIMGWWGILGLIGWGYLVSAFTYVLCRDSILKTSLFALFFLILNILSGLKMLEFLNLVKPVFGIIIEGNVPFIVLTGLIAGLLIKKMPVKEFQKTILVFVGLGIDLYIMRIYSQEMVYYLENPGYPKLGNDLQWHKLFCFHYTLLDIRCEKQDQMGIIPATGR